MEDADMYGFCLLGDGATVRGMPLMNVLVTTPSTNAVLDIIDCTDRMEDGAKKDAKYIADMFQEHIDKLDPHGVHLNAVLFDGASNVQKAGRLIEAKYPQVSVLHGIEHCISLFFADVSRLAWCQFVIINYRRLYRVFGSGSMHAPYAIFRKTAQIFNGGVKIGLIRAADTRMAGYFYALHRMLRLRPALEATVASAEFLGLKLSKAVVTKAVAFVNDKDMWKALYCLLRCLFPALRVLRLADRSDPGFDSLYYFIRRTDLSLEWSKSAFENNEYFTTMTRDFEVVSERMQDAEDRRVEEGDDDELMDMIEERHDGDDGDDDDDEDSDNGSIFDNLPNGRGTGKDLGAQIVYLWKVRKEKMVSDFCIAGWLLSPLEEVMGDVAMGRTDNNTNKEVMAAMDRLLAKMYHRLKEDELGQVMDKFWTEYYDFSKKVGHFGGHRRYIWNSELLRRRKSAMWHAQYSVPFTEVSVACFLICFTIVLLTTSFSSLLQLLQVLGKVACRVLSSLLGIGIAERCWGAVKHLKTGKRSHLGAEATRMQATIFGAACIEKARALKEEKEQSTELWNEKDEEFQLGLENFEADEAHGVAQGRRLNPRRLFYAWREDWEKLSEKNNDVIHEAKLLRKYGGLRWLDPDSKKMFVAETENMEWHRRGLGWCVIGVSEDGELEPWPVKLLPSLIRKTKQLEIMNVEMVHMSKEEKAKRKAAREAEASKKGKGKAGKRKRSNELSSSSESDDSDSDPEPK
jgi:Protein of unknown function (DUF 659)